MYLEFALLQVSQGPEMRHNLATLIHDLVISFKVKIDTLAN